MAAAVNPLALVTGATGFIASHVISNLLESKYRVRATVRSVDCQMGNVVKERFPQIELVQADLCRDEGWTAAVEGCTYVHHIASPLPHLTEERRLDELLRPAKEGTLRVLQACANSGTIKRVIMEGSIAAVSNGMHGNAGNPPDYVYSSEDWTSAETETSGFSAYCKSKLHAEKAAWDFVEKLDESKRFDFVVILPSVVFGPLIYPRACASHDLLLRILKKKFFSIPEITVPFVDVRDVARAHVAAMTNQQASGNRIILWSETVWLIDIAKTYAKEFEPQGYKNIPKKTMSKLTLNIGRRFDKGAKFSYSLLGIKLAFDKKKMGEKLGITDPILWKQCVLDSAYSFVETGVVEKKSKYTGPKSSVD